MWGLDVDDQIEERLSADSVTYGKTGYGKRQQVIILPH